MKVFDSIDAKKWIGKSFEIRGNSILALKSSSFYHDINLKSGQHMIKIMGKKRSGNGKILLEILSGQNDIILSQEINFGTSLANFSASMNVKKNYGQCIIRISRDRNIYGSVEIGRIIISQEEDVAEKIKKAILSKESEPQIAKNAHVLDIVASEKFKRKVCFIVPYQICGGAEIYIKNLISETNSIDFVIVYLRQNNLQNLITQDNVSHVLLKSPVHLPGHMISNDYDIVLYYNSEDIYRRMIALKKEGKISSYLMEIYHSDFEWSGSLSKVTSREELEHMIVVSKSLAANISGEFKRSVLPIPIDSDLFYPSDVKNNYLSNFNGSVIGTVARLSKEKNIEYLIDLAKVLKNDTIVVIGDGPERKSLKILAKDLSNFKILGHKNNVHEYVPSFDAFVLASNMEGTPISILEAMSSGVPVFSNMVGAIPDILTDGKTCFAISGDAKVDAELILKNIDRLDVIMSARNYVAGNHDIKTIQKSFIDILESVGTRYTQVDKSIDILQGEYV